MNYIDFSPLTRFASDGALIHRNTIIPSLNETSSSDMATVTVHSLRKTGSGGGGSGGSGGRGGGGSGGSYDNSTNNKISFINNNIGHHNIVNGYHLNESGANKRLIEALNQLSPTNDNNNNTMKIHSFGSQKDMRFQQKQQLEREQRRVEMTSTKMAVEETTTTTQTTSKSSSSTKALNSSIVPGKVRQMFDERRRGTGIDKSYPLKPLSNNNNNNNSMNNPRSTSGSSSGGSSSAGNSGLISKKNTSTTINSINRNGNIVTNRTQSTITSTKPLRTQQHPVTTINSTISGNLKKTPLNGRLVNASSIQGNSQRTITKTTTTTQHNNMNNNSIDYDNDNDDDIDYTDNHNNNDNYNNNNNNNYDDDDNDVDDDVYLDNGNNENFTVMNEDLMNENSNNLDEENFPDEMNVGKNAIKKKLPNVGKLSLDDRNNNAGGDTKSSSNIKLKPVITRKTLPSSPATNMKQKTNPVRNTPPPKTTGSRSQPNITQKPMKTMTKSNTKMLSTKVEVIKPTEKVSLGPPPEGMAACSICGRHFNVDRIEKHESICQRAATKKRKIFDSTKHRVKGTEAEVYLKRVSKNPGRSDARSTPSGTSLPASIKQPSKAIGNTSQDKKSSWRKKHEEFINAIRAAKEVQKHLARGGKLSDLPPPPPSENPDYVQCPHCSRRFNETAAARHIPKCADMLHNKPKNKPPPKKKF